MDGIAERDASPVASAILDVRHVPLGELARYTTPASIRRIVRLAAGGVPVAAFNSSI